MPSSSKRNFVKQKMINFQLSEKKKRFTVLKNTFHTFVCTQSTLNKQKEQNIVSTALEAELFGILLMKNLSDYLQKSQTPVEALWSLRSIDLRVIALHLTFVKLRIPQNASLFLLISEPIRVNLRTYKTFQSNLKPEPYLTGPL